MNNKINDKINTDHHTAHDEINERDTHSNDGDESHITESTHNGSNHQEQGQHHVDEHAAEENHKGATNNMKDRIESTVASLTILFLIIIGLTADIEAKNIGISINKVDIIENVDIIQKDVIEGIGIRSEIPRIEDAIIGKANIQIIGINETIDNAIITKTDTIRIAGVNEVIGDTLIDGIGRIRIDEINKIDRIEKIIV